MEARSLMPLVLKKSGAVFLHPMKTGGTWVRHALTNAGVQWYDDGDQHADNGSSQDVSVNQRFTIIRNPFDWYRSFWAFRASKGWGGNLMPGHTCKHRSFEHFVLCVCRMHPGFLTEYLNRFATETVRVMRTESLTTDLVRVLGALGEDFDEAKLRATPPVNRSASLLEFNQYQWTPTMVGLVVSSEWSLFLQWDYPLEPQRR